MNCPRVTFAAELGNNSLIGNELCNTQGLTYLNVSAPWL